MWPKIIIIGLICLFAAITLLWDNNTYTKASYEPSDLQHTNPSVAPNFSFTDIYRKTLQLTDFKGKIIVLNFWATWCAPCKEEFPYLLELVSKYSDQVILVALSVDEDPSKILPFLAQFEIETQNQAKSGNVYITHDSKKSISQDLYQSIKYPETYVIGPDQLIHYKIVGPIDESGSQLEKMIMEIMKK